MKNDLKSTWLIAVGLMLLAFNSTLGRTSESFDQHNGSLASQIIRHHKVTTGRVGRSWSELEEYVKPGEIASLSEAFHFVQVDDGEFGGQVVLIQVKLYNPESDRWIVIEAGDRLESKRLTDEQYWDFIERHEILSKKYSKDKPLGKNKRRPSPWHFSESTNSNSNRPIPASRSTYHEGNREVRPLVWWPWALAIALLVFGIGRLIRRMYLRG